MNTAPAYIPVLHGDSPTGIDLFCGAGGSTTGADAAGAEIVQANNHNPLCIETHNTNYPHIAHDCCDVSKSDPARYPRTLFMLASPECRTYTDAGGINYDDDSSDQTNTTSNFRLLASSKSRAKPARSRFPFVLLSSSMYSSWIT